MSAGDVEGRSELARYLGIAAFPGNRQILVDVASDNNAPDAVLNTLQRLPDGREYQNVTEVGILGGATEHHRA